MLDVNINKIFTISLALIFLGLILILYSLYVSDVDSATRIYSTGL